MRRKRVEDELRNYLHGVEKNLTQVCVELSSEVRFGNPANEIISYAHDIQADLIAMW
ncbi:MAG: hypothetical protein U0559_09160 [Anaerolineae bacterium]